MKVRRVAGPRAVYRGIKVRASGGVGTWPRVVRACSGAIPSRMGWFLGRGGGGRVKPCVRPMSYRSDPSSATGYCSAAWAEPRGSILSRGQTSCPAIRHRPGSLLLASSTRVAFRNGDTGRGWRAIDHRSIHSPRKKESEDGGRWGFLKRELHVR